MKSVNNNFLAKLANVDIRRHAAGIKKMILQDAPLKNAALHDIVIFVFYGGATTPWIKLSHIDEVVKTQPDNETNRRTLKIMRESLAADKMNMFLQHFRGGNEPSSEVHEISTSIIAEAHTACTTLVPGVSNIPPWARVPARTYDGREPLLFCLDEIDNCLREVYEKYRPQVQIQGMKVPQSSKTVLDYVERKIAAWELIPEPVFS